MNDMKTSGFGGGATAGTDLTQRFALDVQGFDGLRQTARNDPHAAAKTVAKELNASFLQMMLKSMRDATPSEGVLDSQDGKTYTGMLDQQLTQQLSSHGVGLADSLLKQLGGPQHAQNAQAGAQGHGANDTLSALGGAAGAAGASAAAAAASKSAGGLQGQAFEHGVHPRDGFEPTVAGGGAIGGMAAAVRGGLAASEMASRSVTTTVTVDTRTQIGAAGATAAGQTRASGAMRDRAAMPTMQERVAAVEAAAMEAGWQPSRAAAPAVAAEMGIRGARGPQGYASVSVASTTTRVSGEMDSPSLDDAKPFEESTIRMNGATPHVNAFIAKLAPAAEAASRETGIPSHFILSQVALESGWGKSEIRTANGERTHNVLGVKAGDNWKGPTVTATTVEYIHGQPHHLHEKFRVYGSYKEALQDYANVLKSNSRFQPALRASNTANGFAQGMQKAGYATDPHYARKLLAIIKQMV